jgi:hypothetical protein
MQTLCFAFVLPQKQGRKTCDEAGRARGLYAVRGRACRSVNGETDPSYYDWKLGVSKSFNGGWNVGLFYVQASNDVFENVQSLSTTASDLEDLNAAMVFLQVGRTF